MADKQILTKESLEKYQNELNDLKENKRKEIAQKIKEAREQGDLSENAEYDAAKDEQRDIEARIAELEEIIENAETLDEDEVDHSKVHIGCIVTVTNKTLKKDFTYQIVDKSEVNLLQGRISYDSPIGNALMGKESGAAVEVVIPTGIAKLKIKKIAYEGF